MGLGDQGLTRGQLLQGAGALAAALGPLKHLDLTAATPTRGGTLRLGVSGSTTDVVDAHYAGSRADEARLAAGWETLTSVDSRLRLRSDGLAEEFTAARPDTWTIRLRQGITFHDGRPLTADDVAYTLRRLVSRKLGLYAAGTLAAFDPNGVRKMDSRTLRVSLRRADVMFPYSLAVPWCGVVPVGYSPRKRGAANPNVGTGPFRLASFTPGAQSTHVRNENYWREGQPYLDRVVITDIASETARVNALRSGQVDAIVDIPGAQVRLVRGGSHTEVLASPSGIWPPISMRVDVPPFDDVRVRRAFRLMADRSQLVRQALGGFGRVGNDVYGIYDELSDASLPQRHQDLEQARSLLVRSGRAGMKIELVTTPLAPGMNEGAQVFAQQAQGAGVQVSVRQLDIGGWYANYTKWPFSTDAGYTARNYLVQVATLALPSAPFNRTHWPDGPHRRFVSLWKQATASLRQDRRRELVHEMQRLEYDYGGLLIWGFADQLDGYRSNVRGLRAGTRGMFPLDGYGRGFRALWLS